MKNIIKKTLKINSKNLKRQENSGNQGLKSLQKKLDSENKFLSDFFDLVCVKDEENSSLIYFKRKDNTILSIKLNDGEKIVSFDIKAYLPLVISISQKTIFSNIINELLNPNLRDSEKIVIENNKVVFTRTIYLKKKFTNIDKKSYLLALQDTLNAAHFYAFILEREFINYINILAN